MPRNDPVTLPYHWLGAKAEAPEVVIEYYPPEPLVVVDDSEGCPE
jgi:hypothetical protein